MSTREKYKLLAHEWDLIAEQRLIDLTEGRDKSYFEILKPNMINILGTCNLKSVLDIGCGVGVFTEEVGKLAKEVTAIDISCNSIELAKSNCGNPNIKYECLNIIDLNISEKFTTVVSNMALMTIPDLPIVFQQVGRYLEDEGAFVFSITHPSFWPIYWDYATADFNYNLETEIVKEFKIRGKVYYNLQTRHYHRPISEYLESLLSNHFRLGKFIELRDVDNKYWYPRFLLISCIKIGRH